MKCRALLLGLLLAGLARAQEGVEVIDEVALKPYFEEFEGRFDSLRKQAIKIDEFVLYYQQRAQAKGSKRDQAINAYFYGFVLLKVIPGTQTEEAKRQLQHAVALMPGFLPAYLDLALIAEQAGDRTEAERLVRRTLEIKANWVPAIMQMGQMAHRAGDYARAKVFYNQVLDIKPTVEAFSALVIVNTKLFHQSYDEKEKDELAREALAFADAVVTIEPDNQILRLGKAQVLSDLGRLDEAIAYLENLYVGGTLKPKVQLELLKYLRGVYQYQGNVEGVSSTIDRLLKCEALPPEDRTRIAARQDDLKAMGRNAFVKWQIEDMMQRLANEGLSVEQRKRVQQELQGFITSNAVDFPELRPLVWQAWCECFRRLIDSPPELVVAQLRWMRNHNPPPGLMAVLVHFVYPNGATEEIREEGIRAVAASAGVGAIPSIYYSLQDDSGRVVREVDHQLATLCERRSPRAGKLDPYTPEEIREARRMWASYFHSPEGAAQLAKSFKELQQAVARVQADRTSAPMIDHAANVLLDDDIPWSGWAAAYGFLVSYWGKEFRPVERRGTPVEPFEREHVVKALQQDYAGMRPEPGDDALAPRDAGMAPGK